MFGDQRRGITTVKLVIRNVFYRGGMGIASKSVWLRCSTQKRQSRSSPRRAAASPACRSITALQCASTCSKWAKGRAKASNACGHVVLHQRRASRPNLSIPSASTVDVASSLPPCPRGCEVPP